MQIISAVNNWKLTARYLHCLLLIYLKVLSIHTLILSIHKKNAKKRVLADKIRGLLFSIYI